jgi:predicted lipoprotein with Yx(FWY)xxD motif
MNMRQLVKFSLPAIAASLALAACGSSSKTGNSSTTSQSTAHNAGASAAIVKTASNPLGTILVTSNGMTLYHLSAEHGGKFICSNSACTGIWHPLAVSPGSSPQGQVASLGTIKRPDGTTQVTYNGEPLYTFAQDQQPGETKGQGFKDVGTWTVVTTSSSSGTSSTSTAPATSGSEGGGYRY